jgi:hypothetical protein
MQERTHDPAHYRDIAESLRRLAAKSRFDLCRRAQLLALAAGFERLAGRVERQLIDAPAAD